MPSSGGRTPSAHPLFLTPTPTPTRTVRTVQPTARRGEGMVAVCEEQLAPTCMAELGIRKCEPGCVCVCGNGDDAAAGPLRGGHSSGVSCWHPALPSPLAETSMTGDAGAGRRRCSATGLHTSLKPRFSAAWPAAHVVGRGRGGWALEAGSHPRPRLNPS